MAFIKVRVCCATVSLVRHIPRLVTPVLFSSRRRHTRFDCDWSSDVCSSDLLGLLRRIGPLRWTPAALLHGARGRHRHADRAALPVQRAAAARLEWPLLGLAPARRTEAAHPSAHAPPLAAEVLAVPLPA